MLNHAPILSTTVQDLPSQMEGYVVVDTLCSGKALGGTRITTGVSLTEVAQLARGMTLKLSLAEIPMGGCKGGIRIKNNSSLPRKMVLEAFGRGVSPLLHSGIYLGTDLGCSFADREVFHGAAGYKVPVASKLPCTWGELWTDLGDITGHGAFMSAISYLALHPLPSNQRTVCIQGFGKAGQSMAKRFEKVGYRIICIADLHGTLFNPDGFDINHLLSNTNSEGIIDRNQPSISKFEMTKADGWLDCESGILVLAANGNAITEKNWNRVKSKVLVEAANFPVSDAAEKLLYREQINVIPDILANCGSGVGTALLFMESVPLTPDRPKLVKDCYDSITRIIQSNLQLIDQISKDQRKNLPQVAYELAISRARAIHGIPENLTKVA